MTKKMKLQTLALVLMAFWLAIPATHAQYYEAWVVRHDGPEILEISSNDYVRDMVVRDSYVYVTGYEDSFGGSDWATVKYDYAGQELWVRKYEEGIGRAEAMAVDAAGNVYVTGYSSENYIIDVLTFKYSSDGDLLWEVRYNNPAGNQDKPKDMAFDASGNIYIAGSSDNDAQDDVDLLLLKYNSEGVLLWDRTLDNGDSQTDAGYKLAIDLDGNAIVAGWTEPNPYLVKYSPTGNLLWEDEHVGFSTHDWWQQIETDGLGNIYVLGEISPPGQSNHIWTAKYDPNGNILWEDNYTGTHSYACYEGGIALMPDGGVVITGQSWDEPSNISIVTIRYAPDGTKLWQRLEKAGYAHTSGDDVAVDADGNIYVTGFGYNYTYWEDIITLAYSPDGDLLWTQIYVGPDYESQSDYPHAIEVDEAANVFVAANSWGDNSNDFTTILYSDTSSVTRLDIAAIIEGPFNGTDMNTDLNPALIPLAQPYIKPPWNYTGTESVTSIPNADIVDWILVELRDTTVASLASGSTAIARQAAFLLKDGTVTSLDGSSPLSFNVTITDSLFVVLWHRNHLGIISAYPVTQTGGIYQYDFTTSASQAYGGVFGHKELATGIWGMIAGDGNADKQVTNNDKVDVWQQQAGFSGYLGGDFSLDSQVNIKDKNDLWVPNSGSGEQVPDYSGALSGVPDNMVNGYQCQVPEENSLIP